LLLLYYFQAYPANSQASKQTLSKRENNGLQQTSWQQKYFEKKPCFHFEVDMHW